VTEQSEGREQFKKLKEGKMDIKDGRGRRKDVKDVKEGGKEGGRKKREGRKEGRNEGRKEGRKMDEWMTPPWPHRIEA
jgi:hypothetical protein